MRRKDREVAEISEIKEIIKNGQVVVLGLVDGETPYLVPLNYAFVDERGQASLYFHSALAGHKIDLIKENNKCSFVIYNDLGVKATEQGRSATNYYECIMGDGTITELTDLTDKRAGAKRLLEKYGFPNLGVDDEALNKTFIAKIVINKMSGKKNKEKDDDRY